MIELLGGTMDHGRARGLAFLPSLVLTWMPGLRSYGLTLAWLRWSVTLSWGEGTFPEGHP